MEATPTGLMQRSSDSSSAKSLRSEMLPALLSLAPATTPPNPSTKLRPLLLRLRRADLCVRRLSPTRANHYKFTGKERDARTAGQDRGTDEDRGTCLTKSAVSRAFF